MMNFFGKRGSYPSNVERAFPKSYSGVYGFVRQFNQGDHGALLKELQRVESDLVTRRIGGRLSRAGTGPCISLHDSVFCRRDQLPMVELTFQLQMASIGFSLQLKAD